MNKYTFLFSMTILALVVWLIYEASLGNIVALIIVSVLGAALLIALGARLVSNRDQAAFVANARENLAIMKQMQSVQNMQNTQLLRQVKEGQAPQMSLPGAVLVEDGIFDELD